MRTADEISKYALSNDMPPNEYSLLEFHLFITLKEIYRQFFNHKISKATGEKLKQNAVMQYNNLSKQFQFKEELYQKHIEAISKTETLRIQFRKTKDMNIAIKLIELYSGEFGMFERMISGEQQN